MSKLDNGDEFFSACMTKLIIGCLAVFVGSCLLFSFVMNRLFDFDNCTSGYSSYVREHGEFEFPRTATNIETCDNRFDSNSVSARFEISPSELENFLITTQITLPLASE